MSTQTPRCDRCASKDAWMLLLGMLALVLGHFLGYERAVEQVAECANARTPEIAVAACPEWLR
jgi:hypothetical protein